MLRVKDRVIGVVVNLLSAISKILVRPTVQRIPVRNYISIPRRGR